MTTAFDPIDLSGIQLANRVVMAPMTRNRAFGPGRAPTAATAEYYAQRASAGLIVTEGTQPSPQGQGYPDTAGLHNAEQISGWRRVTDAVHAAGGRIFVQLMHAGRISHPALLPDGLVPVGASAVAARGQAYTAEGPRDYPVPHALTDAEVRATVADYAAAARASAEAGFDGVEVHGANGYLVHQFLAPNTNRRTDGWGGSVAGRIRFAVEVARAVAAEIGPERTGLRVSPGNPFNGIDEPDPEPTYTALVAALEPLGLAYLHVVEGADRGLVTTLRKGFSGTFILNPGPADHRTGPEDLALVEDGTADLLSFGTLFLANPDLPRRLAAGGPFNDPDRSTFYGGDTRGYTDYPALEG